MGEVIGFKRRKLFGLALEQRSLPINLAEPITADKFPTWSHGLADGPPSEYCAPETDGA